MKLTKKKIFGAVIVSLILLVLFFAFADNVLAQASYTNNQASVAQETDKISKNNYPADSTEWKIAGVFGWLLYMIAYAFSQVVSLMVTVMVIVANKSDILDQSVVENGWRIVRDVCNNFFIVILLVVSLATILNIKTYHYKSILPKLLTMAVLINFSKMFAGIMIDFSQLLMLFFAKPFNDLGPGIVFKAVGLYKFYQGTGQTGTVETLINNLNSIDMVWSLILTVIVSVVAAVVIAIITIILVYRIVMFWFLVILSPIAFLATTFPRGQKYSGMWWDEMTKYLIVGPVMMFCLYLSFFVAGDLVDEDGSFETQAGSASDAGIINVDNFGAKQLDDSFATITEGQKSKTFINFMIVIGLMVGSLVVAQKTGVKGGSLAGKGISGLQKWGKKTAFGAASLTGKKLIKPAARFTGGLAKGTDRVLSGSSLYKTGKGLLKPALKGAATGAAAGTFAAPVVGTAIGGLAGAATGAFAKSPWGQSLKGLMTQKLKSKKDRIDDIESTISESDGTNVLKRAGETFKQIGGKNGDYYKVDDNGNFMDETGKKRFKEKDGAYYEVNEQGELLGKKGEVILDGEKPITDLSSANPDLLEKAATGELKNFKKADKVMGEKRKRFWSGFYSSSWGKAGAAKDVAESEKVEKNQKEYSNMSAGVLRQLLKTEQEGIKKMAIAMTLAIKDGFKGATRADVKEAKKAFGSNQALTKKFNDEIDKKFAHLNYDLNTAEGRAKFNSRRDSGKIDDVMDASAYKDPGVIRALQEGLTSKEFVAYTSKVAKRSQKHSDALESGIKEGIQSDSEKDRILDSEGNFTAMRRAMMAMTGNIAQALEGVQIDKGDIEKQVNSGLEKLFKRLSVKQLASLDIDNFDKDKVKGYFNNDETKAKKFVSDVKKHLADNLTNKKIASIERQADTSGELIDILEGINRSNASAAQHNDGSGI